MKKGRIVKATRPPWETTGTEHPEPVKQNHHIIPRSRDGDRNNNILAGIPSDLHYSYHRLFGNLTPPEVLQVLLLYLFRPGKFRRWRSNAKAKNPPFRILEPDHVISILMLKVFPPDWMPGDKLMKKLERKRSKGKS
ncbi:MAG: hypothetical protein WEC39_00620 [Patescibacteria group bacterium]